jgi:thymidylate synthase
MNQLEQLMARVLEKGTRQANRTGVDTITLPGGAMFFDLAEGFPIPTTRKIPFKSAIAEMLCFIRGENDAQVFADAGCKYWLANANENGVMPNPWLSNPHRKGENDLGEIYGVQWRKWFTGETDVAGNYQYIDQFRNAIDQILHNPTNRRIIVNAWNPGRIGRMALPPCHVMFQFLVNVERQELNMCMYIRSNDLFLGAPSNIVEYAFLLELVAEATHLTPRHFSYFVADAHIYVNHIEQVREQISRDPFPMPQIAMDFDHMFLGELSTDNAMNWLETRTADMFKLDGYEHHPQLYGEMAV